MNNMKIKIDIENKNKVIAELEKIISMAEELKYKLSTFKSPEVIVKEEAATETAERLKNYRMRDEGKCQNCGSKRVQPQDNYCLDCGFDFKKTS